MENFLYQNLKKQPILLLCLSVHLSKKKIQKDQIFPSSYSFVLFLDKTTRSSKKQNLSSFCVLSHSLNFCVKSMLR